MIDNITKNVLKVERGLINKIYDIFSINKLNGKFLFLTDEHLYSIYGENVVNQINKIGTVDILFVNDNSLENAIQISKKLIEEDFKYVVGLGGGRVLDVCKYASYSAKKIFISIPTTVANDGVASPIAVLKMNNGKVKSLGSKMAQMILLDTDIINNGPKELVKAGIGDTISNYMALLDWELADKRNIEKINDLAYMMSKESLNALLRTQYNSICPEFIEVLASSIILSGLAMNFAGTSRPVSGSEHLFSHAVDYYSNSNNLHGFTVALGTIAMLKLIKHDYSEVLNYLKKFEININPVHLNISEEDFVNCMQKAPKMRNDRYTYLNEININEEELKKIYKELVEEL